MDVRGVFIILVGLALAIGLFTQYKKIPALFQLLVGILLIFKIIIGTAILLNKTDLIVVLLLLDLIFGEISIVLFNKKTQFSKNEISLFYANRILFVILVFWFVLKLYAF